MATAIGSTPALPPDPLQLKRRLLLQGGGFSPLLLISFSGTLYWDIAHQRTEDQRAELRQLAATAALERLGFVRVALSDHAALADLQRLRRGLLLGGIVTAMAALLVGRRMLRAAFLPLQQQVSALQRFTADASHELRHPLTALRTLLAGVPSELRQQPGLAWTELDRLSRRMGELLELLEDLVRCYTPQANGCAIQLQLSPEAGRVPLKVQTTSRQVLVTVRDQGPVIPPDLREQVFDRFWSGVDRGGHSGLGLAIGRAIARRHGGELRLGESRPGCCELVVALPAATQRFPTS